MSVRTAAKAALRRAAVRYRAKEFTRERNGGIQRLQSRTRPMSCFALHKR